MKLRQNLYLVAFATCCHQIYGQGPGESERRSLDESLTNETFNLATYFPAVYTIIFPLDFSDSIDLSMFLSELDIIDSQSLEDNKFLLLALVHNEAEMEEIENSKQPVQQFLEIFRNPKETINLYELEAKLKHSIPRNQDTIPGFECYRSVSGIFGLMHTLVEKAKSIPALSVDMIDIGDSYLKTENADEGNDIMVLKITGDGVEKRGMTTEKGVFFMTCGIHAREYAPVELGARWAELLVNRYGVDIDITTVLDHTLIYIILESNPDGRTVAEAYTNLYWRKNKRPGCGNTDRQGVDLNRNFPFNWGVAGGSSSDECSQTYRGASPASEPEVQAIIEYAKEVFPATQRKDFPELQLNVPYPETVRGIFIDIHSSGELIIWPWSFKNQKSPNDEGLQALARKIRGFNNYKLSGPELPGFLYISSGVTVEWFYGALGAAGFTYEVGTSFYQDCQEFENTIVPDNLPSFTYAAKVSTKPFSLSKGPDVVEISVENKMNYRSGENVTITVTVSDSKLSPGCVVDCTSSQPISTITVTIDMHPYDLDEVGNGPNLIVFPVNDNSGTVTTKISFPLPSSDLLWQYTADQEHLIYIYGTDSDGYDGVVSVVNLSSTPSPTNNPATPSPNNKPTTPSPTNNPTTPSPTNKPTTPSPPTKFSLTRLTKTWLKNKINKNKDIMASTQSPTVKK